MKVEILKCFIASPSDTNEEREACEEVLAEINADIGDLYNIRIEPIKWENDTFPDFGKDGQDVINKQLRPGTQDFFIGIMWKHFGTPTSRAGSGTEEEFDLAYAAWTKNKDVNIQFYFNNKPTAMDMIDPGQWAKVSDFKEKISDKGGLYAPYVGLDDFKKKLLKNIKKSVSRKYQKQIDSKQLDENKNSIFTSRLETDLRHALRAYKGQPEVFIEPKLSKSRDVTDEENLLEDLISNPENSIIAAPPQFGLTCLSFHMRLEAFKRGEFWIYIDAQHIKTRNALKYIDQQLDSFEKKAAEIKCIIIDGWIHSDPEHRKLVKRINHEHKNAKFILATSCNGLSVPRPELEITTGEFQTLHLQALCTHSMRKIVEGYLPAEQAEVQEQLLGEISTHLKSINIHRTPLNCLTLLRVNGSNFNEKLLNKTKLMKAIMFVLFTDSDSFSYLDKRPDVDECTYVLAKFCKGLVTTKSLSFKIIDFRKQLKKTCDEDLIGLDVDLMIETLVDNCILLKLGDYYEFKHRYWIYYFAAECMFHDDEFKAYILNDQRYSSYPDIIDFYTGIDGRRKNMVSTLLNDLKELTDQVEKGIGISDTYNPLSKFLWNPSSEFIEKTRKEITEKVGSSNLPPKIKDQYADSNYDSNEPYDQSINEFLEEYMVQRLRGTIAAASRALRNSSFVDPTLKMEMAKAIISGWEALSRVTFWISPLLARDGKASHEGFGFYLKDGFSDDIKERLKQIFVVNPSNIVGLVKDDLKSKKIGKVLFKLLNDTRSNLQKHLIAIFIIDVKPDGWYEVALDHLNKLHPCSYYLGNLLSTLENQIRLGLITTQEQIQLKQLTQAALAKRYYASKALKTNTKEIPEAELISKDNELPVDKLLTNPTESTPKKYGEAKLRR